MSSAIVTDQNPFSSGYSVTRSVQWIGHWPRICLNSSCGGPSAQTLVLCQEHVLRDRWKRTPCCTLQSSPVAGAIILAGWPAWSEPDRLCDRARRFARERQEPGGDSAPSTLSSPTVRRPTRSSPTSSEPIGGTLDRQPADRQSADRQRAERDGASRQRAYRPGHLPTRRRVPSPGAHDSARATSDHPLVRARPLASAAVVAEDAAACAAAFSDSARPA